MQRNITLFFLVICLSMAMLATEFTSTVNADLIPKPAIFPMTITILSPSYGQEVIRNDFLLNFSITDIPSNEIRMWVYPDNGIRPHSPPVVFNGWVWVYLDGNDTNTFPVYPISLDVVETQPALFYSFNLTGAPEGEHTISVKVSCASQYSINLNGMSNPTNISISATNTPPPSTQTTQPLTEETLILLTTTSIIVILAIAVVFLLLNRNIKKKHNLSQT